MAHNDELTAVDYMTSGIRFPVLQQSSINDIVKNAQNIKFMLGRGLLGVSNAKSFSFTGNLARLQQRADMIDPSKTMTLLDRGGNVMTYNTDVKDASGNVIHKQGEQMEVSTKQYLEDIIAEMKNQSQEHWGKGEMIKFENALVERVNKGKMPAVYMEAYTRTDTHGKRYLEPTGSVVGGVTQYRLSNPTPATAGGLPPAGGPAVPGTTTP